MSKTMVEPFTAPRAPGRTRTFFFRALSTALLGVAPAACGGAEDAPGAQTPERLTGRWSMELRLTSPAILTTDTAGLKPVLGTVVLMENRDRTIASAVSGFVPTHYGTYAADLRSFHLGTRDHVPAVVARLATADSAELAFDPGEPGGFLAAGTLDGDSIHGRWSYGTGRTAGRGSGTFVMRRP